MVIQALLAVCVLHYAVIYGLSRYQSAVFAYQAHI